MRISYYVGNSGDISPHSQFRIWNPTTKDEITGFDVVQMELGLDWRYKFR